VLHAGASHGVDACDRVRYRARMTTLVYLVRHGEVDPDWRGRIYGGLDIELSDGGRDEARTSARVLAAAPIDRVISSPLRRARYSADLIAEPRGLGVLEHDGLREIDRGEWAGLTFEELDARDPGAHARWLADPIAKRPPGGESLGDLARRVRSALVDALDGHADGPPRVAAVAAHGWVVRTLLCDALGVPYDAAERLRTRTGSVHAVEWRAGAPRRLAGLDLDAALDPDAGLDRDAELERASR